MEAAADFASFFYTFNEIFNLSPAEVGWREMEYLLVFRTTRDEYLAELAKKRHKGR